MITAYEVQRDIERLERLLLRQERKAQATRYAIKGAKVILKILQEKEA